MKYAALRGLVVGLTLSAAFLGTLGAWHFGCWVASVIHPPQYVLDVR